jgi:hypothetical protein
VYQLLVDLFVDLFVVVIEDLFLQLLAPTNENDKLTVVVETTVKPVAALSLALTGASSNEVVLIGQG